MGILFDFDQSFGDKDEYIPLTFRDFVAEDIDTTFFQTAEHAERHTIDGKELPVILDENNVRARSSHWEAGAKQNFDTGLYTLRTTLYVKVSDYGGKPKQDKRLVIDGKRTYSIKQCEEECGVYRMTLERVRQG